MKNCYPAWQASESSDSTPTLTAHQYSTACQGWLISGEIQGWSRRTIDDRRIWVDRLGDFLVARDQDFSVDSLRIYFLALGKGSDGRCRGPLRPASVKHVHSLLSAFCSWCIAEGMLSANPMKRIPTPRLPDDRVKQYTDDELVRILQAARSSRNAARDVALISFLSDTGIRASELAALRLEDVDLSARIALVKCGKGGKLRTIAFGRETAQSLWRYLRNEPREQGDYLFASERGRAMTRSSLLQLCRRLGKVAGVKGVGPHRFRHDACVRLLRGGANLFQTMQALGHTKAATTQIYVRLAETDLRNAYQVASPIDNLRTKGKGR